MARITGPMEKVIPCVPVATNGLPLVLPMDLTEGGFLQVVPGKNPMAQAVPSVYVPPGCMVAIIPPNISQELRASIIKQPIHTLAQHPEG